MSAFLQHQYGSEEEISYEREPPSHDTYECSLVPRLVDIIGCREYLKVNLETIQVFLTRVILPLCINRHVLRRSHLSAMSALYRYVHEQRRTLSNFVTTYYTRYTVCLTPPLRHIWAKSNSNTLSYGLGRSLQNRKENIHVYLALVREAPVDQSREAAKQKYGAKSKSLVYVGTIIPRLDIEGMNTSHPQVNKITYT